MEDLLKPISADAPTGSDIRMQPIFDAMKEARRFEDPNVSYGVWSHDLKKTDWTELEHLATTCLKKTSKDLQVATWLIECWINKEDMKGFVRGLDFLIALQEKFGDKLYPQSDQEKMYEWIDNTLEAHIMTLKLDTNGLTYAGWQKALYNDQVKRLGKKVESKDMTLETFKHTLRSNTKEAIEKTKEAVEKSLNYTKKLDFIKTKQILEKIKVLLENECKSLEQEPQPKENEKKVEPKMTTIPPQKSPPPKKEDLYRKIAELNQMIKKMDPHSLSPVLIDLGIFTINKTLPQILHEAKTNPNYEILKIFFK